ncbi:MAG: hypothetical protein ABSH48_05485 [Verrucomicrobiota bacterium]|jgi:hypothetical protein
MSNIADMGLDLENLFQPAWAQGKSEANRFEKFTGDEGVRPERRRSEGERRDRGPRREGGPGERRGGEGRPPRASGGGKFGDRRGAPRREDRREDRREPAEPARPLPELNVAFIPEEKGVELLARQIRMTGRAYPLFQIAQLILQKGERYSVQLTTRKKPDGTPLQPIYVCALDDTPWTSEDEAVAHVLKNHFATFYQIDRTPCDPPKGVYTFVAQCGMSGVILGPPNYHDYQNQLRKLHAEKFSRMPFDVFKARVKIVKDEAVVKKWIEEQSFKIEYTCLNVPEPLKLPSLDEVEKHFRATHKDSIIKPADTYTVAGLPSRSLRSGGLQQLIRQEWEHQRHFPLPIATRLSQQFASHGLQFFKVDRTITHVSVARPQYLDIESNPVSDGIRRIVQFINGSPKCTRKKLIEALAPTPKAAPAALAKPPAPAATPAPDSPAPAVAMAPAAETPVPAGPPVEGAAAPAPAKSAVAAPGPEPTPEQTAVMLDLHWLIHQGAVLEFADGRMETAKKPLPKPPKPEKKVEEKAGEQPATGEPSATAETPVITETPAAAETAPAVAESPDPAPAAVTAPEAAPEGHDSAAPVETPVAVETAPDPAPEAPAPTPESAASSGN